MPASKNFTWRLKDKHLEVSLNREFYPEEPLYATCYVFMSRYYISLDVSKDNKWYTLVFASKDNNKDTIHPKETVGEFQNELIHNMLRYKIASRNQKVRECIVKEALFFSQPKDEQEKAARKLSQKEKSAKRA